MSTPGRHTGPSPQSVARVLALGLVSLVVLFSLVGVLGHASRLDESTDFDRSVHTWVIRTRVSWPLLTGLFHLATRFGNPDVATVATVTVTLGLYALSRLGVGGIRRSEALVWIGVILGGRMISIGLKTFYRRERPPLDNRLVPVSAYSFPSGHSVFAAVFFTMLALLLVRAIPASRPRPRAAAAAACFASAVLVALSRVWLGVHYPTDVAAGLLLGSGWVLLIWLARVGWRHLRGRTSTDSPRLTPPAPGE